MKSSNQDHKIELHDPTEYFEKYGPFLGEDGVPEVDVINSPTLFLEFPKKEIGDFRGVAQKIKHARTTFGITQKQMATVLNMSQQTYSEIEKDGNQILPKTLVPIAAFFNLSFSYFFGFTDDFLLLQDRTCFFNVNGYTLLDFVDSEKISKVFHENCFKYEYEDEDMVIEEQEYSEYIKSKEYYEYLKKIFEPNQ